MKRNENSGSLWHQITSDMGNRSSSYISKMIDEGFHTLQVAELASNSPQTIYQHYYTISDKEKMKEMLNQVF